MLTPYLPYPLYSGGQIRTYNLLKSLAQHHEITLFSFIRNSEEEKYTKELLKFCKRVQTFKRRPAWSLINIFLAGFTAYPFLVSIYYSLALKRAIKKELANNKYDLIHSETFYVMPTIPETSVPILLVEQTIEFLVYQHFVEESPFFLRPFLSLDVAKIRYWEKFFWKKAKRVVAMSAADSNVMTSEIADLDVEIIPNGVDSAFFASAKKMKHGEKRALFVGNFKWLQNKEAVEILIEHIWPKIRKVLPEAKLWIVGRFPPMQIKQYDKRNNILIFDDVEDIRSAYAQTDVLLAPIYGPGGTRYKILEAMASSLPVVTTTKGIEGLGATNGREVIIRESNEDLAAATVAILQNARNAQKIATASKKFVSNHYSWYSIAQKLDMLYREVAHV